VDIPKDTLGLVAAFTVSGVTHLVKPETFEPLMPAWLPAHRELIYASGVAELVCAAGILHPRTRKAAGWASAALLVAVFPGNVKMAADAQKTRNTTYKRTTLARLPMQLPLIRAALKATRA
jgi:uncharacterized membrane protein